jgi:hypothetical protein
MQPFDHQPFAIMRIDCSGLLQQLVVLGKNLGDLSRAFGCRIG